MADDDKNPTEKVLDFGPFRLFRRQKILVENGTPVQLGSRAFEILVALVERAGELVSKSELMAYAWPNTLVDESNLRVHIAALRKILGDGHGGVRYIVNISGRGYSFVASVSREAGHVHESTRHPGQRRMLPVPLTRIVGRADALQSIAARLSDKRLVTIVGPGGVGKSTVALAIADGGVERGNVVCFVDLSGVEDSSLVHAAIATAMGVSVLADDPIASLVAFLERSSMLIVLDNCEHALGRVAEIVERLLKEAPRITVLTTSREPLLAEGEWLHHLSPLCIPPPVTGEITAADVRGYSAVELFVERASNSLDTFELNDGNARPIVDICRRLDGIPLAIELAAARLDLFRVEGLASWLDERPFLSARGRRTASPRHQSLRSMFDWSYQILSANEQTVFRRLSVFRGAFTLDSAVAVCAVEPIGHDEVVDGVISLASKSLVTTDVSTGVVYYRLLHVTRAYAADLLAESGERGAISQRHAEHYRVLLDGSQSDWDQMTRAQWLDRYGRTIDDVRVALDWAFGSDGDVAIGAALTAASLPFGVQLSLVDEFKRRAERALEALARVSPPQPLSELRLTMALGNLYMNSSGEDERISSIFEQAAALSERIDAKKYRIEPLTKRALFQIERGNYADAVEICERLLRAAKEEDDPLAILLAERTAAQTHHFAGNHERAQALAERVLNHPAKVIPLAYSQTSVDRRVSMRIILSRILWLQGLPDQATAVVNEAMGLAGADGPFALSQTLALAACPIAMWRGDADAHAVIARLLDNSRRYTLNRWHTLGLCYQLALGSEGGSTDAETQFARPASMMQWDMVATVASGPINPDVIARAGATQVSWCGAELWRAAGEVWMQEGETERAEAAFRTSLGIAEQQGALSWALRSGTSLAQLLRRHSRSTEAAELLAPIYNRFTEGFNTADLKRARQTLADLTGGSLEIRGNADTDSPGSRRTDRAYLVGIERLRG